jgi:hypothetical protein
MELLELNPCFFILTPWPALINEGASLYLYQDNTKIQTITWPKYSTSLKGQSWNPQDSIWMAPSKGFQLKKKRSIPSFKYRWESYKFLQIQTYQTCPHTIHLIDSEGQSIYRSKDKFFSHKWNWIDIKISKKVAPPLVLKAICENQELVESYTIH